MPKWKRGRYYHGYVRVSGVMSEQRTTGCTDPQAAEAVLRGWERELADPAYAASKGRRLKEPIAGFLKQFAALVTARKKSQATLDYYTEKCGTVARIIGAEGPLAAINAPLIDSYIEARREELASEHSISKELRALKVVLKYAKRQGWFSGDFDAIFPAFSSGYDPRERYLTEDELFALCTAIPSPDAAAQLAFACATSAEMGAIQKAQRADVAEGGQYVLLRGTKRELRWRTVPIVTDLQRRLLAFAMKHAKGQGVLLFAGAEALRNALRRTCEKLGIPHCSPNDLRRTFAVHMREQGFALELIAPLMGHKDTRMLQVVYGRLTPEQLRERLVLSLRIVGEANARAHVRETGDAGRGSSAAAREETVSRGVLPLLLRNAKDRACRQPSADSIVRVPSQPNLGSNGSEFKVLGISNMGSDAGPLRQSQQPTLEQLWGTGDRGLRSLADLPWLLQGHGPATFQQSLVGQDQQRRQLRAEQLPVGDAEGAGQQSPQQQEALVLNAVAACRNGVVNEGEKRATQMHALPRKPLNLAPRPGFEPGTYGLTVWQAASENSSGPERVYLS